MKIKRIKYYKSLLVSLEIIGWFAVYTLYRILIFENIIRDYWMVCCVYPIQDTNIRKYYKRLLDGLLCIPYTGY